MSKKQQTPSESAQLVEAIERISKYLDSDPDLKGVFGVVRKLTAEITDPEGDVPPTLHITLPDDRRISVDARVSSREHKYFLFGVAIPELIKLRKALQVVVVSTVWVSEPGWTKAPSLDPNRTEALVVTEITPQAMVMYHGAIHRDHVQPPWFEELENVGPLEPGSAPLYEPIQQALQKVAAGS